ncbi:Protein of unknown function (DUF3303) [Candidatus Methanoperedens nitroreducens]|uniref:DUF3303 domain-containing protein n=1 Tax=Candidatus Methanoperedens nitratireducens TaxID=1392998 RepID=A0A062VD46_9EURY|nr:DUF3303 family protein [Candidatus Methanoperedens nitroreducens]KCZ73584.1 Protein of unknown function (DUF3303) [Candidatus Methanoperedens nitroreducens]MDJ1422456.1 DUF3303 family protein [Candidatus Methanoperedens sp.]
MLFMDIWTWEPDKRDEVIKRATGLKSPEGMKVLGEWLDLTGNRIFLLYEVDDPRVILEASYIWTDIAKVDSVPVMDAKIAMELMPKV